MRGLAEAVVFLGVALCLHAVIFTLRPSSGSEAGGVGGESLVSLTGATQQIAAMVETWEQPPEAAQQPDTLEAPVPVQAAPPNMPEFDLEAAPDRSIQLPTSDPTPEARLPEVETTTPPPPAPAAVPKTVQRPQNRPERAEPSGRAQVTQAGRAAQRAAGTGGGRQAGQSAVAQASTLSAGQEAELQAVWGAQIRSRIERKKSFPSGASGSGRVVVLITVSRSGSMLGHRIHTSSGSGAFDASAMQAVARATRLPAAPPELTAPQYSFALPITFSR
ncbi:TonB family protein [Roseobacter sp.]|uniref:energy transducer TonB n=1 Tax=Roseobacter sp. TaxID=1907202 RepID=UPI002965D0F3|nr:TonB family protein [Roseobacter sp.]MDW3183779.1 TonB family protein [Roseobacter sp.]